MLFVGCKPKGRPEGVFSTSSELKSIGERYATVLTLGPGDRCWRWHALRPSAKSSKGDQVTWSRCKLAAEPDDDGAYNLEFMFDDGTSNTVSLYYPLKNAVVLRWESGTGHFSTRFERGLDEDVKRHNPPAAPTTNAFPTQGPPKTPL